MSTGDDSPSGPADGSRTSRNHPADALGRAEPVLPPRESPPARSFSARLSDELRRVPTWLWAVLFAAVLCLPFLGRFGFWDPWELKLAEQARDVARSGH